MRRCCAKQKKNRKCVWHTPRRSSRPATLLQLRFFFSPSPSAFSPLSLPSERKSKPETAEKEKTTLLNILAHFIPEQERILVIEDTAEIQISALNLVRFEARVAQNDFPAVTIRELLKTSLRHRPDRIILGEIRGAEAFDLLQLLNTGHSGTISTVHANSALQALSRFTSCVLQSNVELPYRAIKSNIADSLNLLVHVDRRHGRRFVSEVLRMEGYDPELDHYRFKPIFSKEEDLETRCSVRS